MSLPLGRITGLRPDDVRALKLDDWGPVDPECVADGEAIQHGLIIVQGATADEGFGVWRCTPYTSTWMIYPYHEFVQLIDGEITIETEGGATTWRAGDSFFIPAGLRLRWVQPVEVLKLWFIGFPPAAPTD